VLGDRGFPLCVVAAGENHVVAEASRVVAG
jgi:hypothetical protein